MNGVVMSKEVALVVEFRHARCGGCMVALRDQLATSCPNCKAVFDRLQSGHAGLARQFERRRAEAGVFEPKAN